MVELAVRFTELNCMRAAAARLPLPDLAALTAQGYTVLPVLRARVWHSDPALPDPDPAWTAAPLGRDTDVILAGPFTYDLPQRYHCNPVGSVMRRGTLEAVGLDRAAYRGGLAVLADGSLVLARSDGNSEREIQAAYAEGEQAVVDFIGGGALLVEYGQPVPSHDLLEVQAFTAGKGGINAPQLQRSDHVAVGVRHGQAFAVLAWNRTGREIRQDLLHAGFTSVVKFAGGSAACYRDKAGIQAQGTNSVGLAIKLRRV